MDTEKLIEKAVELYLLGLAVEDARKNFELYCHQELLRNPKR